MDVSALEAAGSKAGSALLVFGSRGELSCQRNSSINCVLRESSDTSPHPRHL